MIYYLKNNEVNIIELDSITEKGIRKNYFDKINNNIYIQQLLDLYLLINKQKQNDEIWNFWKMI
ncbi:hypothetical protein SKUN_001391 [Spiroplasma kunkelii CR2-3x]|uniref:Uncharacterized protein n=1 Tax=Spiroplasma kunkelii CR2-3x TaxID=273035 RepID=A0A0K2JIK9_SPIKU|nr:hypothetical protein [Spiroplasma kunkelii]ALA98258.1 hypothetical protein SKUN_001391 [Spiroplasma kunkelii CR2-3x]